MDSLPDFPLLSLFDHARLGGGGAKRKHYSKGQLLYLADQFCSTLDVVLSGSISIQSIDAEGNIFKARVLQAGDIYGATLLFGSFNRYPMQVVCDSQAEILHLKKSLVLQLCEENQQFLLGLLALISDRAHELSRTVSQLSAQSLKESLLGYLQTLSHQQGSTLVMLPTSKKELADRLGFARTSVSRALKAMEEEGLLSLEGRVIHLHISSKS